MTATTTAAPAGTSVSSWLLPTRTEARIRFDRVVLRSTDNERRTRVLRNLGAVARSALAEEIETKLRAVLNETFADLIVSGWRAHGAIIQAFRKSRAEPGVDQVVPLRNHTITANRHVDLDIEVDGVRVVTLSVQLVLRLQVYDAVAIVRDVHLVAVRSGQANVTGTVTVEGVEVARRTLTFPLTAELTLQRPRDLSP